MVKRLYVIVFRNKGTTASHVLGR